MTTRLGFGCYGSGGRYETPQILHRFNPLAQAALEEGRGRLEGEYVVLSGATESDVDRLAEDRFEALMDEGGAW